VLGRHSGVQLGGSFFFLPVISPFMELNGGRGQLIVGIVSGWLFVRQWRRLRSREAEAKVTPAGVQASAGLVASS
jgi:hypothetical protein